MKLTKVLLTGLMILAPALSAYASSRSATSCEARRQDVEQQLSYARKYGNSYRVSGLEKALSDIDANCTDEGLRAERESDLRDKERKVEERRRDLARAQAELDEAKGKMN